MVSEGGGYFNSEYNRMRSEYIDLWKECHWPEYHDPISPQLFLDARDAWKRYWLNKNL